MASILFTICGRAGSKGLKNKNLKDFLEYPLAFYTLSALDLFIKNHPEHSCDLALSTDSDDLIELVQNKSKIEINTVNRPAEIAGDEAPKISAIRHAYHSLVERKNKDYDIVVDLDITSPLRKLRDLENVIDKKLSTQTPVIYTVTEARRNPYFNMVMKNNDGLYERVIKSDFNARQEAPEIYDMNASIYAYSIEFMSDEIGIFDADNDIVIMDDTAVLDIDSERDFLLMEIIAKYLYNSDKEYREIRDNISKIIRN